MYYTVNDKTMAIEYYGSLTELVNQIAPRITTDLTETHKNEIKADIALSYRCCNGHWDDDGYIFVTLNGDLLALFVEDDPDELWEMEWA